MSRLIHKSRSTSRIPSKDSTGEAGSLPQATSTYSQLRKHKMDAQLLVVVGKRTQSQKSHVPVQDLPIEVPVNTWANMVEYLKAQA
jgi:hypothetical protein